jgi:MFS family permease
MTSRETAARAGGSASGRIGAFSALRQREFGLLWWSGVGQAVGLGMQQITLGYFVFELTRSEFWVGAVAFMNFAPFFVFSLFAGALSDRMDRRRLLMAAQAGSGLAVLVLATLITANVVAIWQVMLIAFIAATGQALTVPVRFAFVNELVEPRYLMNAIALNSLAQNGMRVLGPVVAGLLIAAIGSGTTMYVNASGYLLGLIPLTLLHSRPRPAITTGASVLGQIAEGMRFALATPVVLFALLLGNVAFSLFGMPYVSMLPVFAREVLDRGPTGLGLLSSAGGVGSVAGGILLAHLGDYPYKRRLFKGFFLLFMSALVLFSLSSHFYLSLVLVTLVGLGSMSHINVGTVIIQSVTPHALQGRVMSLWTWGICLAFLGALPVGALAEVFGPQPVMATSAALGLLCGVALMLVYRRATVDPPAAAAPGPEAARRAPSAARAPTQGGDA